MQASNFAHASSLALIWLIARTVCARALSSGAGLCGVDEWLWHRALCPLSSSTCARARKGAVELGLMPACVCTACARNRLHHGT